MPELLCMVVETPKGSYTKRGPGGSIEYLSPFAVPFNYGRIEGRLGADGECQDALLLGAFVEADTQFHGHAIGVVRFIDDDVVDDKWILSPTGRISSSDFLMLTRFFSLYTVIKKIGGLLRRGSCNTCFQGIDLWKSNHME
jgi:inorganic pyrophosphatase